MRRKIKGRVLTLFMLSLRKMRIRVWSSSKSAEDIVSFIIWSLFTLSLFLFFRLSQQRTLFIIWSSFTLSLFLSFRSTLLCSLFDSFYPFFVSFFIFLKVCRAHCTVHPLRTFGCFCAKLLFSHFWVRWHRFAQFSFSLFAFFSISKLSLWKMQRSFSVMASKEPETNWILEA